MKKIINNVIKPQLAQACNSCKVKIERLTVNYIMKKEATIT